MRISLQLRTIHARHQHTASITAFTLTAKPSPHPRTPSATDRFCYQKTNACNQPELIAPKKYRTVHVPRFIILTGHKIQFMNEPEISPL
jgi:hypothetical protein